jgi:hypothetical protein
MGRRLLNNKGVKKMSLFEFLNGNNYGVYNRKVARQIGLNSTVLLSEILDKYCYFLEKGKLINAPEHEGLWFYLTADDIFERTSLTEKEQRPCIKKLISMGFLKTTSFGLPFKRHFQICEEKIEEFIISINFSRGDKRPDLTLQKVNSGGDKRPDSPIYKNPIEETKEDPKCEREAEDAFASSSHTHKNLSPPPNPKEEVFTFGYVEMKRSEKEALDKAYGVSLVEDYIERVSDWFSNNLKHHKEKRNDAARVRTWIKNDGHKKNPPDKINFTQNEISFSRPRKYHPNYAWCVEKLQEHLDLQLKEGIVMHDRYIDFSSLPEGKIYYDSEGFKERFECNINKLK